jgi:hypothetical protein
VWCSDVVVPKTAVLKKRLFALEKKELVLVRALCWMHKVVIKKGDRSADKVGVALWFASQSWIDPS